MTGQPPPDPRSRNRDLGFDELVAIFVSLAAIGTILFWGLTRGDGMRLTDLGVFADPTLESDRTRIIPGTRPESDRTIITEESAPIQPSPTVQAPIPATPVAPAVVPPRSVTDRAATAPQTTPAPPAATGPIVIAPPPTAAAVQFPDVPADYWARPFIDDLSQRRIITGLEDGTYRPEQAVTRAQFATLIQSILPPDRTQASIAFNDVSADYWATPAINAAVQSGFLRGYPDGSFQPDQPVSRVQVLTSLVNGLQLSPAASNDNVNRYTDADQIPDWAIPIVATATNEGLVVNHPDVNQLNPNQPATRAEIAAIIYQALEATGQVPPIQSQFVVQP
ncbi:S-layer homology domain-containing protein [Thermocoleostomius sinensis]|uniref:S-layer homology domain-containing protein n=1 Tax=Thermocoleostomius sinensis A174 TaxID=2016057 RepID=A0A9E8ZH04_9CYAN|nr:S-layer homology domain-containing protein [Thermocoleostomius sinensis]WAL61035.1 S-layer homology domain-containing protein [Thermocoleostomius sinensis A174]